MTSCKLEQCLNNCFIESPIFDNWIEVNKPSHSLLICSPYLKNFAIDKIISCYNLYDESKSIKVEVLIRGKLEDFIQGSSDISALESLIQLKNIDIDNINRLTNLHMKSYLVDEKKLLIGSGNCTQSGFFAENMSGNVEGSICTTNLEIINNFKKYYLNIKASSEPFSSFYDKIVKEYNDYIESDAMVTNIKSKISSSIKKDENRSKFKFTQTRSKSENKESNFNGNEMLTITVADIPQFSNFEHGTSKITEILVKHNNEGLTFNEIGIYLQGKKSDAANKKYGENHSKLAELLDLVTITNARPRKVFITKLGVVFTNSSDTKKDKILMAQISRTAIVKDIIEKSSWQSFNLLEYLKLYLAISTAKRRCSNVKRLFKFLHNNGISEMDRIIQKL